jgi:hypothetical protein
MSEMVYSRHGGELVLAEYAQDERTVAAALKDLDPQLRLTWEVCQKTGRTVWNVVKVWSPEHPAVQILTWRDERTLEPYPLTSRIVDEVKRLRQVDTMRESDLANARLRERQSRDEFNDTLEAVTDFKKIVDTGRIHVPVTVGNQKLAAAKRRGRELGRAA